MALAAGAALKQYVSRETDRRSLRGTTSTTALCMTFHALQAAMIEQTGCRAEQFALIHPGGAVGERLNRKPLRAFCQNATHPQTAEKVDQNAENRKKM